MTQQSFTPDSVTLQPRNRYHDIDQALATDWFDNCIFKTSLFNALSITFPLGEKFFIDSVKYFEKEITDPKLLKEVKDFYAQESVHRREHDRYNQSLCSQRNYNLAKYEKMLSKYIAMAYKLLTPEERLGVTAALEHITAILAEVVLDDTFSDNYSIHPQMLALWRWHAAEEMEHKAVSFDVLKVVAEDEKMRLKMMKLARYSLIRDTIFIMSNMLWRGGHFFKLSVWMQGYKFLFGKEGLFRKLKPAYNSYMQRDFHPWQRNTQELLENWRLGTL